MVVTLIVPNDLGDARTRAFTSAMRVPCVAAEESALTEPLVLDSRIRRKDRERLAAKTEPPRALALLGLTAKLQADGLVTTRSTLIAARYSLSQYHRIRVIPLLELADVVEVCAHGHSIFWSASGLISRSNADVFYQFANPQNRRLAEWMWSVWPQLGAAGVQEEWRSAILNRYGFLLYTRDMIRFYEMQMHHYERRGVRRRFSQPLGYYVSNFYLHVWGMLEHLTLIARQVLALEIDARACGIESRTFWRAAGAKRTELRSEIRGKKMGEWIGIMADMRHPAAHRAMLLPSDLVRESEQSKKSDAEISDILHREEPDYYEGMSSDAKDLLEKERIRLWRMDHLETIGSNVIAVNKGTGGYFWFPVNSVDYDLGMLTKVMNVFIRVLFKGPGK